MTTAEKRTYVHLACLAAALAALAGCGTHSLDYVVKEVSPGIPVLIGGTGMEPGTKAAHLDSTNFNDFVLYAGWARNGQFDGTTVANDYMNGTKVTQDWSTGVWSTRVRYYWPARGNGTISFFALAPYVSDSTVLRLSPGYTSGEPVFLYTPGQSAEHQKDLCVAAGLYDRTSADNPLSFNFVHALSNVQFWANYRAGTGGLPAGHHLKIDRITLHNVMGTKGLSWQRGSPGFVWSADTDEAEDLADYTLSRTDEELTDTQLPSEPDSLHLEYAKGIMHLLPQTINEQGQSVRTTIEIDFSIYRQEGSTSVRLSTFNIVSELPSGTVWSPSGVVRYHFTLNVENLSKVEISTSTTTLIGDWRDSGNPDPGRTIGK